MPIIRDFALPANAQLLELPEGSPKFFIAFVSSDDPVTSQPWCPDVRAALPHINAAFAGDAPTVAIVPVGQKPEWRDPKNVYRTNWNINNVPALVRFEVVEGKVSATGKLIEGEILDKAKLGAFLA
ncbi:uncharacterized protein N7484_000231 [Penicillium longicatenatum]|uniref:uncharacterized protein n=1 Tax=Penicillium longicatenatum TaxID=1561947 RepID=UPI0025492209|nr:uncharacterized protein N7484_000231 [Penicillium longicatenatum]KAJ5660859.1 hypothetical protein N7484_000231 [Penicillium longicatenatum]